MSYSPEYVRMAHITLRQYILLPTMTFTPLSDSLFRSLVAPANVKKQGVVLTGAFQCLWYQIELLIKYDY